VLLGRQGKYPEALAEFRAASLANPKNAMSLGNLGSVYLQLGRVNESMVSLRQSLEIRPNAAAAASMAEALRSQGKPSSVQFAKNATELDPGDSESWLELGDCYSTMRDHDVDARKAYEEGGRIQQENLETYPTDGTGWMLLALFEAKTGSAKEARLHMQKADTLPSADLDTQMFRARIQELLGMREDALRTLAACFARGMTRQQVEFMPEMAALRRQPEYQRLLNHPGA